MKKKTQWQLTLTWANGDKISSTHAAPITQSQANHWKQVCQDICGKNSQGERYQTSVMGRVES